ncbi:hypothetical protein GE061_005040 [Apolygus lucorum]|uniref:Uncharacterized protein n=1 Tax=Apolygus lucorum TaxID=248454 RepID=A0A8S9WV65_APOLU|nr:hypothetical protein GE061_005040 [Apolygus lucorum]
MIEVMDVGDVNEVRRYDSRLWHWYNRLDRQTFIDDEQAAKKNMLLGQLRHMIGILMSLSPSVNRLHIGQSWASDLRSHHQEISWKPQLAYTGRRKQDSVPSQKQNFFSRSAAVESTPSTPKVSTQPSTQAKQPTTSGQKKAAFGNNPTDA